MSKANLCIGSHITCGPQQHKNSSRDCSNIDTFFEEFSETPGDWWHEGDKHVEGNFTLK